MFGISQLGAAVGSASPGGDSEWNAYFGALRDNVNANWSRAVTSYKTLKSVRETLGLPFIVNQGTGEGTGNLVGAWSSDLEQQAVNVHAMVVLITGALDDVIINKRRVSPSQDGAGWAVERLPGDVLRLETKPPGIPVLVNAQTGQPENVQGTVGAIWIPVALVAAATIVTVGEIYLCVRAVNALESIMKEKTTQTIAKRNAELIASGKATPEQAAALTKAEGAAAADLAKARAEENNSGASPEKWSPLVKTVVWGGVAIMALYIAAKLIPSRSGGLATNPIKSNPVVRYQRGYWVVEAYDPVAGYWAVVNSRGNIPSPGKRPRFTKVAAENIADRLREDLSRGERIRIRSVAPPLHSADTRPSRNPLSLAGVDFLPNPSGAGWYLMHYERGYRAGVTDFKGPFASRSEATEHIPSSWERRYLIKKLSSQRALALAFGVHERSANPIKKNPRLSPRARRAGRYRYVIETYDPDFRGTGGWVASAGASTAEIAEEKKRMVEAQYGLATRIRVKNPIESNPFFNPLSLASVNLV